MEDHDRTFCMEEASAGLKSIEQLIRALSSQHNQPQLDCKEITDFTVSKFKQVISILNRTGRARFRRRPSDPEKSSLYFDPHELSKDPITPSTTSSFISSFTAGDGSVSNGQNGLTLLSPPSPPDVSDVKPPLPAINRKTCKYHLSSSGGCHCTKGTRKSSMKRSIRVPAISSKIADIPSDEYTWRKYGQKEIKGSPHPRGYYRCSGVRRCPAKKHVERAQDDPNMLIVTYKGEHSH